ncbi:MAG: c-type cytochrome domain-containing protein [Chitinophagales bacterium]
MVCLTVGISCQHEIFVGNEEIETIEPCNPQFIHYMNDIQPILSASCAVPGCHDAATPTAQINLASYEGVMSTKVRGELIVKPGDGAGSILNRSLRAQDIIVVMPPPFNLAITDAQKNLIRDWIDQGAVNAEPCVNIDCDTMRFDWSTTIRPIIRTYCNGCHYGDYAYGDVLLSFHSQVQELALNGDLFNSITGQEGVRLMPLDVPLPDCKITQIKKWIENGAPRD